MCFDDQPEPSLEIIDGSHAHGFSDQPRHTVAPLVVQAFDDAGFAAAFIAGAMLPACEPFGIGVIEVAIDQFATIISRQRKPQAHQASSAAVADGKADDLPCQARNCNPQITVTPLRTKANHQLIKLQCIAFDGR